MPPYPRRPSGSIKYNMYPLPLSPSTRKRYISIIPTLVFTMHSALAGKYLVMWLTWRTRQILFLRWILLVRVCLDFRWKGILIWHDYSGVSLTWYGVIRPELPITPTTGSFAIDGGKPEIFRLKGLTSGEITQYNQIFFQTPQFQQGKHTIAVTYLGDLTTTPLTLDYLIVQNGTAPSVTPPNNSSTTGNANTAPEQHSHSSVGPIVGGVVGGLAVVAIIGVVIFLYLRRRRNKVEEGDDDNVVIQPFQYSSASSPGVSYVSSNRLQNQEGSSTYSANVTPATTSLMGRSSTSTGSIFNQSSHVILPPLGTSKARREAEAVAAASARRTQATVSPTTSEPSSTSRVIMHEDSGVRLPLPEINEDVIEVPPQYTQT